MMLLQILKKYPPLKDTYAGDDLVMWINIVGGSIIGICFLTIGIALFANARYSAVEPGAKMRMIFSQMVASFLSACGASRLIDVISIWNHLAWIEGILKCLTGMIALIAIFYVPKVIKAVSQTKTLLEVSDQLKETKEKVDKLQEATDKLTGGNK